MEAYSQNIVIDLEFTPTTKDVRRKGLGFEIIEIGAAKLDALGNEIDTFSSFVAPRFSEGVSAKVRKLTGIRDCDICHVERLEKVLPAFVEWIGEGSTRMVSWSESDKAQIEKELAFKQIEMPSQFTRWLDLQKVYPRVMEVGNDQHMALRVAADWYGVALNDESAHRALYDAEATVRLLEQLLNGEYQAHKKTLQATMSKPGKQGALTSSIGSMCGELAELFAEMDSGRCAIFAPHRHDKTASLGEHMTDQEMEEIIAKVEHSLVVEHTVMTDDEKENLRRIRRDALSYQYPIA